MRACDRQEIAQQLITEEERHEAEVQKLGVRRPVVVLFGLDPGILEVDDLRSAGCVGDLLRQLADGERLGELVEHPELAGLGRVSDGQLDTGERVPDVEEAARLAALAVHGQRLAGCSLDHETVEHGPEHRVVVETRRQIGVQRRLRGRLPVDDALVEVGRSKPPRPAAESDVVAVVHLGQVIEASRLLGEREDVGPSPVGDLDVPLFDVDVGCAVLPHRPELHQVDRRVDLGDRVQQVERADDIVDLCVHAVLAVDHGVGRAALLGEVHDGVRPETPHHVVHEGLVGQVADEGLEALARDVFPAVHPLV